MVTCKGPQQIWENISSRLVDAVEIFFFKLGAQVARHPWRTIVVTWLFIALSAIGFLRFHLEKNPMKLWVPLESDFFRDTEWFIDKFGSGVRAQMVLVTADDVLRPEVLSKLSEINQKVSTIQVVEYEDNEFRNYSMKDLCLKVPVISSLSSLLTFDPTTVFYNDLYCDFVSNFNLTCLEQNALDVFSSKTYFFNVTKDEIVDRFNKTLYNPVTGHPFDFTTLLGDVLRDSDGVIISAKSILTIWNAHVDFASVDINEVGNLVGTEDWVSKPLLKWEEAFLEVMKTIAANSSDMNVYYQAGRSYGDISGETMFQDIDKLFYGIALMFIYIQVVLSGPSCLEIRLTLGSVGLLCVGMAYVTACSWCSILGIPYGPVHASLPFLLMGLGIDDMFVMKACWEQLTEDEARKSLEVKIGLMLKHAGVSIVITSFTDIVAFLIGSITILPSLKSFCFYAAMGVFFIFCFSVTFYVAIFTLDIRRMQANRNGLVFCYKHKRESRGIIQRKSLFQRMFNFFYKNIVFTLPCKLIVIGFTLVMTAFSIDAVLRLEQRFDPLWFIPDDTYFKQFLDKHKFYYPNEGYPASIFIGEIDYNKDMMKLNDMIQLIRNESFIYGLNTWVEDFDVYMKNNFKKNVFETPLPDNKFELYMSKFLFSPSGGKYQSNLRFSEQLVCGKPIPNITASSFQFRFSRFEGPKEYLPAMNRIKDIVRSSNITSGDGYLSVWARIFANWVTDEIIAVEVERNVELALICVMACTIILITNLQMCLWIFICVLLTLINVCGWMQRWGMTIDIVSCIGLELAIGLCVDYAAHIGHTFLTLNTGDRSNRALKTVTSIGTAVLYGGGSTLLSLSVLSMSRAYTFSAFFKIFLLVIIFGLFHGLLFLPVMLSLVGPQGYHKIDTEEVNEKNVELKTVNLNKKMLDPETVELNGKLTED